MERTVHIRHTAHRAHAAPTGGTSNCIHSTQPTQTAHTAHVRHNTHRAHTCTQHAQHSPHTRYKGTHSKQGHTTLGHTVHTAHTAQTAHTAHTAPLVRTSHTDAAWDRKKHATDGPNGTIQQKTQQPRKERLTSDIRHTGHTWHPQEQNGRNARHCNPRIILKYYILKHFPPRSITGRHKHAGAA
jgi:hypothetical protein